MKLEDLPNVGPILASELRAAGIASAEQLRATGAKAAWLQLREVNPERHCSQSLLALEGALRGVRWMALEPAERQRIASQARSLQTS